MKHFHSWTFLVSVILSLVAAWVNDGWLMLLFIVLSLVFAWAAEAKENSDFEEPADLEKVLRENRAATVPYIGPDRRASPSKPRSEPDARCISIPDGGCIADDCMHTDPPKGKLRLSDSEWREDDIH